MDSQKIQEAVKMILEAIGEDPSRSGLVDTPQRVAKMYQEIFEGIGKEAQDILATSFEIEEDNIVVEKDIPFYSMCEHHLLPFWGKVHIAYLPRGRVAGLSKLARTVGLYAAKPQIQERLTLEVGRAIMDFLGARGVLVVVEADHMCMNMRGVKKPGTRTVTSMARGVFEEDKDLKAEAYRLMGL